MWAWAGTDGATLNEAVEALRSGHLHSSGRGKQKQAIEMTALEMINVKKRRAGHRGSGCFGWGGSEPSSGTAMPASVLLAVVVSTGPEPRVCRIQTAAGSDVDEGAHGPQRAQVHEVPDPSGTQNRWQPPCQECLLANPQWAYRVGKYYSNLLLACSGPEGRPPRVRDRH